MLDATEKEAVRKMQDSHEALRSGKATADEARAVNRELRETHGEDRYEAIKWALACHEAPYVSWVTS